MGLRATTLENIKATIDKSEFSKYMFEITTDNPSLLNIRFKLNPNFCFTIKKKSKIELTDGSIQAGYHDPISYFGSLGDSFRDMRQLMAKPKPAKTIYYYETVEAPGEL